MDGGVGDVCGGGDICVWWLCGVHGGCGGGGRCVSLILQELYMINK